MALTALALLMGTLVFLPREDVVDNRDTIRVVIRRYLSYAPLFVAYEDGFFAREGLEVEFLIMTGTSMAIPSLVQGDIDVLPAAIMPAYFNIINRGAQMKVVAGKGYYSTEGCVYSGLVARRSLMESGEISGASDLIGRRITTNRTIPTYFLIERYLESGGLTLDDMEVIDIPIAAKFNAFASNALDVATASEPWLTRLLQDGHSVLLARSSDFLPDFQFGLLLFGKNLLENRRETGQKFILAYLKAVRHMNAVGKTDRQIEIVSKYTGLDKALLEKTCWPSIRNDGRAHARSFIDYQQWALEQGLINEITAMDVLYDSSFIEAANQILDTETEER